MTTNSSKPGTPSPIWSPEQEAIFAFARDSHSIQVEAVAGSGKTTTGVEFIARAPHVPTLALTFNKRNQLDLEAKMPRHVHCKTANALGHNAWRIKISPKKLTLKTSKLYGILVDDLELADDTLRDTQALVNAARSEGLVPESAPHSPTPILPDTPESWEYLADRYDLELTPDLIVLAREALVRSITLGFAGIIDFADQVYLPIIYQAKFPRYSLILADEDQDFSPLQHAMIALCLAPSGRLIGLGDRHQAIYGFRGALTNSIDTLVTTYSMRELPLSTSYRCSQAVAEEARRWVPHLQARPDAPPGVVTTAPALIPSALVPGASAILCRNNAPLIAVAYTLLSERVPINILGRDLGSRLQAIVRKVSPEPAPTPLFRDRLQYYISAQVRKYPKREGSLRDQEAALLCLLPHVRDSAQLLALLGHLFTERTNAVTISTIHKSKGFEWDHVYFLHPDLIDPFRPGWQGEQEANLLYVGATRAKLTLTYIEPEDERIQSTRIQSAIREALLSLQADIDLGREDPYAD